MKWNLKFSYHAIKSYTLGLQIYLVLRALSDLDIEY